LQAFYEISFVGVRNVSRYNAADRFKGGGESMEWRSWLVDITFGHWIDDTEPMFIYRIIQILTIIVCIAGTCLTASVIANAHRTGIVQTRFGTFSRDIYPTAYRLFMLLYGLSTIVLLSAAGVGVAYVTTQRY
jgi:ABC-type multidrug transport system permease subunit